MNGLSLSKKVWFVISLLCLSFVGTAVFSTVKLLEEKNTVNQISNVLIKQDQLTSDLSYYQKSITTSILELIVRDDEEHIQKVEKEFDKNIENFTKAFSDYKKISDAKGLLLADKYEKDYSVFLEAAKNARAFAMENKDKDAAAALFKADETRGRLRAVLGDMNKLTADELSVATRAADQAASNAILVQTLVASISILISVIIAFFVLKSVNGSIGKVVRGLAESSERVTSAASQIAAASQELSSASTEQAAALVETASATEEMSSMVSKNSDNAKSTAENSSRSNEKAVEGKSVVDQMILSMERINKSNDEVMNQVNESNRSMLDVVKVIQEIGTKTKVINDIVFQTKLLSFNASVEAARAGEHGKGFAVVAEEIGSLAQMSGAAAKEISELLEASISKVNDLVRATQTGVEEKVREGKEAVETGNRVAIKCGDVLDEIVDNVGTTSKMAEEISAASEEQSRGVIEITKAMGQLDQMTQSNTATSQECASAASDLSSQAEALKQLVNDLVFAVEGARDAAMNATIAHNDEEEVREISKAAKFTHFKKKAS